MLVTTARRAALALALVAGLVGYGAGLAAGEGKGYAATVRGCGSYLAEDEAAHVRLAVFERADDGGLTLVYRCKGGW